MIALLFAHAFACDEPSTNGDVRETARSAMAAFEGMDSQGFSAGSKSSLDQLPCLNEAATPKTAATVLRLQGLERFLADENTDAQLFFAGARRIEPTYRFPEAIAPEGHPLLEDYLALDVTADEPKALPRLAEGSYRINGQNTGERSANYPVLFQQLDGDGKVLVTGLLLSRDKAPVVAEMLPDIVPEPLDDPKPTMATKAKKKRNGAKLPLLISGVALGAAAGGLYAGNRSARKGYDDFFETTLNGVEDPGQDDLDEFDSRRSTTNTLGLATYGAGGAALGLLTTSFVLSGSF